jgi:phage replication-related protein YjqB (UPF0714/DUF867 family)
MVVLRNPFGHWVEGTDYRRTCCPVPGATTAVIAVHGGAIEAGSGEMARQVAGATRGFYEFAGIRPSGNGALHVTSTFFDDPLLLDLLAGVDHCLSFHGFTGRPGAAATALGGLDTVMGDRIAAALTGAGFTVTAAASEIAGTNPANICNRTRSGRGVQLELSRALRESFFPAADLNRSTRESRRRTEAFVTYAAAVTSAIEI